MLDVYYKYKFRYNYYIIFIKSGIFYECYNIDVLIINKILKYKLKKINNTFKIGFPISNLDNVLNKISDINYLVNNIILENKIDNNKYNNYKFDIDKLLYNYIRIEKITKYLEDNITNIDISNKVDIIMGVMDI